MITDDQSAWSILFLAGATGRNSIVKCLSRESIKASVEYASRMLRKYLSALHYPLDSIQEYLPITDASLIYTPIHDRTLEDVCSSLIYKVYNPICWPIRIWSNRPDKVCLFFSFLID